MNLQQNLLKLDGHLVQLLIAILTLPVAWESLKEQKFLNFDHHHCKVESLLAKCKTEVRIWCMAAKSVFVRLTKLVSFVLHRGYLLNSFFFISVYIWFTLFLLPILVSKFTG